MKPISAETLIRQLLDLGVQPGGVLLVHTAFSKIKPIEGGPAALIAALRAALGSKGTLVMPSNGFQRRKALLQRLFGKRIWRSLTPALR